VVAVAAMFAVSSAVATIGSVILVDRLLPRAPRVLLPARARDLARRIRAVAGAALCDLARARLVAPFVFVLAGEAAAGYFGVAQRLYDLLLVVPASLVTAAYPELARSGPGDPAFRRLVRQVVEVLVVLGLAVALTLHAGAAALTRLVFGAAYAPAAPLLGLLGVAASLAFMNYFLSSVLLALERPRALVTLSAIALVSALVLTPALVGPFGAVGGIGVLIALEMISLGLGLGVLVPMVGSPFGRDTVKILAVAAAAALAATLALHPGHLRTGLALLLYLAGLALVRPACLTLGLAIVTRASRYRPARMR